MIAIIDYGMGNLKSVYNALVKIGCECKITADKDEIRKADKLILPGVGAFKDCMDNLRKADLVDLIREEAASGKPLLGICLGMQVLFEKGYEGEETEEIIKGTSIQCCNCDKWFYAEGEVTIDTTCTPIEDKVLEPWVKRNIEQSYEHMDICDEKGCEWDSPFGVVEYETYKQYAEPLFKNMEIDKESEE